MPKTSTLVGTPVTRTSGDRPVSAEPSRRPPSDRSFSPRPYSRTTSARSNRGQSKAPPAWQHGHVPMREECKNFESRTYARGDGAEVQPRPRARGSVALPRPLLGLRAPPRRRQLGHGTLVHAGDPREPPSLEAAPSCSTRPRTSSTPSALRSSPRSTATSAGSRSGSGSARSDRGLDAFLSYSAVLRTVAHDKKRRVAVTPGPRRAPAAP